MSDSRKDKELILPPPVNNESDGLRVKEAVANKEKETSSQAAAQSSSSSSSSSSLSELPGSTSATSLSSSMMLDDDENENSAAAASSTTLTSSRASPKKTPKKSLSKCAFCSKKTGLNGFVCRCGDNFCSLHRLPEKHSCTFDFQSRGKESIQRANPLVQRSKVSAI